MKSHLSRRQRRPVFSILFLIFAGLAVCLLSRPPAAGAAMPGSFADLAKKQGPTVVNIYTTQTVKTNMLPYQFMFPNPEEIPEPFKKFFNFPFNQEQSPQQEYKRTSLGSGVITSADGYILTNNHVVEDADEIHVTLSTFDEYEAKIIGRDPKTDLALIKIAPKSNLPFVSFGDSDQLEVGDWVVAIGNPFGLEQTVTAGIVSAKGRSINNESYGNFIQTDASINPGNSGGALFNVNGEMVGVNTAIYSRSGGNIGIGFAIPVNMAKNVLQQIKENGKVVRGWLGVMIQQVTPELARSFGLARPIGALVGEVAADGPAAKAKIKTGDVIISFNGKEISQMTMLPAMVAQTEVGSRAELVLIRDGKEKTVQVTIGKLEENDQAEAGTEQNEQNRALGLTVQEISPELAESLKLEERTGLLVSNVEANSAADDAGLKRGDIIMEVDQKPVSRLSELKEILQKKKKDDRVPLLVKRGKRSRFTAIRIK